MPDAESGMRAFVVEKEIAAFRERSVPRRREGEDIAEGAGFAGHRLHLADPVRGVTSLQGDPPGAPLAVGLVAVDIHNELVALAFLDLGEKVVGQPEGALSARRRETARGEDRGSAGGPAPDARRPVGARAAAGDRS